MKGAVSFCTRTGAWFHRTWFPVKTKNRLRISRQGKFLRR